MTVPPEPHTIVGVIENKILSNDSKPLKKILWCSTQWRAILAELISTTLLILFGCMTCIPIPGITEMSPFYSPLGFGLTVLINIQIFGHISGAHMNPTVTLAAVISHKISIPLAIAYFIAQTLGATAGYGILVALQPINLAEAAICVTLPYQSHTVIQSLFIEIFLTAVLNFAVCSLWDPVNEAKNETNAIKFGLIITGLSIIGGPWTGAGMNPVRSLGPAIYTGVWDAHWIYWVGPFIGSAIASLLYKLIFLTKSVE